jgi:hypothetical protein
MGGNKYYNCYQECQLVRLGVIVQIICDILLQWSSNVFWTKTKASNLD